MVLSKKYRDADERREDGVTNAPDDSLMAARETSHGTRLSDVTFPNRLGPSTSTTAIIVRPDSCQRNCFRDCLSPFLPVH